MKTYLFLCSYCLLFCRTSVLNAKPELIVVKNIVASASYAGEAIILRSDGNGIFFFRALHHRDTLLSAECGCMPAEFFIGDSIRKHEYWMEYCATVGDTVFIVLERNWVKLMGKRIGKYYKVGCPYFYFSTPQFEIEAPILATDMRYRMEEPKSWEWCSESFLIPVDSIENLVQRYKRQFYARLNSVSLNAFVGNKLWDVASNPTLEYYEKLYWSEFELGVLVMEYANGGKVEIVLEQMAGLRLPILPPPWKQESAWFFEKKIKRLGWI